MAIRNNQSFSIQSSTRSVSTNTSEQIWKRNKAWPEFPESVSSSDEKFVGLCAVWPGDNTGNNGNESSVTCQVSNSGTYQVERVGISTTNRSTNQYVEWSTPFDNNALYDATVTFTDTGDVVTRSSHGYIEGDIVQFYRISSTTGITEGKDYYVINPTTNTFQISATESGSAVALTTDGSGSLLPYKIETIKITPTSGNIERLDLDNKFAPFSRGGYTSGWLEIKLSLPSCTSLQLSNISDFTAVMAKYLESIEIYNLSSSITSFQNMCSGCTNLQNFVIDPSLSSNVTSFSSAFSDCYNLDRAPYLDTSSATNISFMFNECFKLKKLPLYDFSSVTNATAAFQSCTSLEEIPQFDFSSCTIMSSTFASCYSLKEVPYLNTGLVLSFSSCFSSCYSLAKVADFDMTSVTSVNFMFSNCRSLITAPNFLNFNSSGVDQARSVFSNCVALRKVPDTDYTSCTNWDDHFSNCISLEKLPRYNMPNMNNGRSSVLYNCANIQVIPSHWNFGTGTSSSGLSISGCASLQRIESTDLYDVSFSVANAKLSFNSLNEIYTNLSTVTSQTITVSSNPGTVADNTSIATDKGWTVTG